MAAGQGDDRAVVEIVVPKTVQPKAAFVRRPDQPRLLRLVFGHEKNRALARRGPRFPRDAGENVFLGFIKNALGGVETEAVEMEFLDPVARVADEKLAHRPGVWAVEVQGRAPIGFVAVSRVVVGENAEVISFRSKMVVNDIENDRDA